VQPENIEDDEKSVDPWAEPISTEEVLARIDEANRREAKADMDLDYGWGGDGSDLHEPVRAHVEAALVPTDAPYPPPLDELLRLGDPRKGEDLDARIAALGLTEAHVPDLVRMARDRALNTAMSETDEVWAPIHALEALKQLDVSEVAADLVPLFDVDTDWIGSDLPEVLRNTGARGLELVGDYVRDRERWIYGRAVATEALTKIVEQQPELRERAVQILSEELAQAEANDPTVNGTLLSELLTLEAVEALPVIRQAFEQDAVDEMVAGDWSTALVELGQTPDPADPLVARSQARWKEVQARMFPPFLAEPLLPRAAPRPAVKKSSRSTPKTKRKMADASRKANRKKKRK
jgi:hypothetical protein